MTKHLICRADASTEIGTGHLMRCVTLAGAWRASGGEVHFVTACDSPALLELIGQAGSVTTVREACPDPEDVRITSDRVKDCPGCAVVIDGYVFDADYQRTIREAGCTLLVVDDVVHADHYYADFVLNQNLHARANKYACEPHTRFLLGPAYALLRREFLAWKSWRRQIPNRARRLLVTLGGSDPANETLKVLRALAVTHIPDLEPVIVVGAGNPHLDRLRSEAALLLPRGHIVHDAHNMAEWMAWADTAVSAGGTTCWELAFMGLPNLILVLSDNQRDIARSLDETGVSRSLGDAHHVKEKRIAEGLVALVTDHDARAAMSARGRAMVDGAGAERVVEILQNPAA
ncbi:MAG TPA: UDP-2,4-diacetamido-2,4,6-trideoxy-beta-L-altropyranose hydrolase [Candidatus Hydrogenedentes bacterium]|nr:UDP-2,4-diacetamido-2,4,6-trideoxy-beta-L-altropyranose hydrolase [Candidatus Hydrogenedentota bacterium]HIJ72982.1 UDP-2,4-diacetamido-2,4,6-trideoxy-beta-L-altropyranose hydrolase [Candidatus Hydrogenedentota bacterium]